PQMEEIKWIKHYSSNHKILLVGEGDFSFAASLASAFGNASNMTATSLDSEVMLEIKHPTAAANLGLLKSKGCTIIHEVNACTMSRHPQLEHMEFDRIVFNFPHAGYTNYSEHNYIQICLHKEVVRGFFKSAYQMVSAVGEVHVTHKTAYPFSAWEIKKLAEGAEFKLIEEVKFHIYEYRGYQNKRGDGDRSNSTFPIGECSTFKFAKYY
ncbi:hypothetical protein STAS_09844, partial [Striga asiatica]